MKNHQLRDKNEIYFDAYKKWENIKHDLGSGLRCKVK